MNISSLKTNSISKFHWKCRHTWIKSSKNTLWCLLGCSIGDFGTILYFQINQIEISIVLPIFNEKKIIPELIQRTIKSVEKNSLARHRICIHTDTLPLDYVWNIFLFKIRIESIN